MLEKFEQIPSPQDSNYLLFSMRPLDGIKRRLQKFPDYNKANPCENTGCSATLLWSGSEGNNTPLTTYRDEDNPFNLGVILNPEHLNIQQADLIAYRSGSRIVPEILKKNAVSSDERGDIPYKTNDPTKGGYYRHGMGQQIFVTNLAKHEKLAKGKSIYHNEGSPFILAKNIWRKYFHKPKKYLTNGNMNFNEAICFQKADQNPISGILVTQAIDQSTAKAILNHLTDNSQLKLYFYNNKAKEHIIRYLDNDQAKQYLQNIIEYNQDEHGFKKAFEEANAFRGFKFSPNNTVNSHFDFSAIDTHIERLQKEINSCWPYPDKGRKAAKIIGLNELKKLIINGTELNLAIKKAEHDHPALREGIISRRTVDLLDKLRELKYESILSKG